MICANRWLLSAMRLKPSTILAPLCRATVRWPWTCTTQRWRSSPRASWTDHRTVCKRTWSLPRWTCTHALRGMTWKARACAPKAVVCGIPARMSTGRTGIEMPTARTTGKRTGIADARTTVSGAAPMPARTIRVTGTVAAGSAIVHPPAGDRAGMRRPPGAIVRARPAARNQRPTPRLQETSGSGRRHVHRGRAGGRRPRSSLRRPHAHRRMTAPASLPVQPLFPLPPKSGRCQPRPSMRTMFPLM
jgi:hypothetical protein